MDFHGKVALITGTSAGIGRAAAIKFAMCGAKVVIFDINEEGLPKTKNVLAKTRKECEEKLTEPIKTVKAEIAEMKKAAKNA